MVGDVGTTWSIELTRVGGTEQVRVALPTAIAASDVGFAKELVLAGAGVAILPRLSTDASLDAGTLVHVLPSYTAPSVNLYLLHRAGRFVPPKVRVFDIANPENPLADFTLVYLPTANGDVFLGDSVTTYDVPAMGGQPAGTINILHKGYPNAADALDWMFKTYRDPKTVAVMGWSAGALASPLYTHIVAQHYPDATVTHFADGGGAYRVGKKLAPLFESWGTANVLRSVEGFEDLSVDGLSFEDLYIRSATLHPDIVFHQYNEGRDAIQALS